MFRKGKVGHNNKLCRDTFISMVIKGFYWLRLLRVFSGALNPSSWGALGHNSTIPAVTKIESLRKILKLLIFLINEYIYIFST